MDRCSKCGSNFVTTRYEREYGQERLRKRCGRCGYSWTVPCLDADTNLHPQWPLKPSRGE